MIGKRLTLEKEKNKYKNNLVNMGILRCKITDDNMKKLTIKVESWRLLLKNILGKHLTFIKEKTWKKLRINHLCKSMIIFYFFQLVAHDFPLNKK